MTITQHDLLAELFVKIREAEKDSTSTLDKAKQTIKEVDTVAWIHDSQSNSCLYINDAGLKYLHGIDGNDQSAGNNDILTRCIHPKYLDAYFRAHIFWRNATEKKFKTTFLLKTKNGNWRWNYCIGKAFTFDKNIRPVHILNVVYDIESLLYLHEEEAKFEYMRANWKKYDSLTRREHNILELIGQGFDSKEIAEKLFISANTVHTHRKNLIRKLGVRSSVGLGRIYLLFNSPYWEAFRSGIPD